MDFENIKAFEGVIIRNNALVERRWVSDNKETNEGDYKEFDVTNNLISYLPFACLIDNNTTLRDLFNLLAKHKDILSNIFNKYHFTEYLDYGIKSPILNRQERNKSEFLGDVEYLEIYTFVEHINSEYVSEDIYLELPCKDNSEEKWKTLVHEKGTKVRESTWSMLGFRGLSYPMNEELMKKHGYKDNKYLDKRTKFIFFGEDISWLMDCEIKISHILNLHETYYISHKWEDLKWKNYYNFTLFDAISCIFHQISMHGDIKESRKIKDKLNKI